MVPRQSGRNLMVDVIQKRKLRPGHRIVMTERGGCHTAQAALCQVLDGATPCQSETSLFDCEMQVPPCLNHDSPQGTGTFLISFSLFSVVKTGRGGTLRPGLVGGDGASVLRDWGPIRIFLMTPSGSRMNKWERLHVTIGFEGTAALPIKIAPVAHKSVRLAGVSPLTQDAQIAAGGFIVKLIQDGNGLLAPGLARMETMTWVFRDFSML